VITRDVRGAVDRAVAAAGFPPGTDPGLRPTGTPGQYAVSVAFALGANPRETAAALAAKLAEEPWIKAAEPAGPGYLTITVTPEALAAVADRITEAGPACATSDALAGLTVPAPPRGDPLAAATWEEARVALAAQLTARLAAAAGAMVAASQDEERMRLTPQPQASSGQGVSRPRSEDPKSEPTATAQRQETAGSGGSDTMADFAIGPAGTRIGGYGGSLPRESRAVADAVAFAGRDAVTFTLARAMPGRSLHVDPRIIARHVPGNPAYAVRYAHARAASGVRWAASSQAVVTSDVWVHLDETRPGAPDPIRWRSVPSGSAHGDTGGQGGWRAGAPHPGGLLPREITAPGELTVLDALSWLPERVAAAARRGRPDEFARYLEDLASVTVDVLSSASHPGSAAAPGTDRLGLAAAARTGLAAGLDLLGISAPNRL
jgi:arginyl-tRNA synthetase